MADFVSEGGAEIIRNVPGGTVHLLQRPVCIKVSEKKGVRKTKNASSRRHELGT